MGIEDGVDVTVMDLVHMMVEPFCVKCSVTEVKYEILDHGTEKELHCKLERRSNTFRAEVEW